MKEGYFRWTKRVYWMPNRAGYTIDPKEAGLYTGAMVEDCAGCQGDWLLEPISRTERFERFPNIMKSMCDDWDAAGEPV